jgi:hypothetical protein
MKNTANLTQGFDPVTARTIALTVPGMAHFAATGPLGATCQECVFWGYWRQRRNTSGDIVGTLRRPGCCKKYHELTRQHGPQVPARTEACRHFQQRDGQ